MSFELKFTNFDFDKNLSQSGLNAGPLFDAAPPEPVGPTLYIGIGGSGKDVLLRLREKLFVRHEQEYKNQMKFPLEFLYYDFDPNWAKNDERRIYEEPYFKANVGFRHDEIFYASNEIKSVLADIDSPRQAHIDRKSVV